MKLSKERLKEIFYQMIGYGNYCEKYAVSLQGHIEALEQENTELKQENLQRLEEVKGLQRRVESLTEHGYKKVGQVSQLKKDLSSAWAAYNAEREARILLEATLERAMLDQQKVVLSLKQTNALDVLKHGFGLSNYDIITNLAICSWGNDKAIYFNAVFDIDRDKLVLALVNGYTVVQTAEDKLKTGISEIIIKWFGKDGVHPDEDFVDLTHRLSKYVKEIYSNN